MLQPAAPCPAAGTIEEMTQLFTIGHSAHTAEHLADLLLRAGVTVVADVRSQPFSRWHPQHSQDAMRTQLDRAGIGYVHLGDRLGGRPAGVRPAGGFDLIARSAAFRDGLDELIERCETTPVAVLCAEENPAACHRNLLVARHVEPAGVRVVHLRGDGRQQPSERQLSLLGDD